MHYQGKVLDNTDGEVNEVEGECGINATGKCPQERVKKKKKTLENASEG